MPPEAADATPPQTAPPGPELAARGGMMPLGGQPGRRAMLHQRRFFTPLRVALGLATLTLMIAWFKDRTCAYLPWTSGTQFTHLCYSDIIGTWQSQGLDRGAVPYLDYLGQTANGTSPGGVAHPVLVGLFSYIANLLATPLKWLSASILGQDHALVGYEAYFVVSALMLSACFLVATWAVSRSVGAHRWIAAMFALSPLVMMHAFTDWTLLAVALSCVGVMYSVRGNQIRAGIFLGLAVSAAIYPLAILLAIIFVGLRTGRVSEAFRTVGLAAAAWLVINLPMIAVAAKGWGYFWWVSASSPGEPTSLWTLSQRIFSRAPEFLYSPLIGPATINVASAVLFVLIAAGVWVVVARAAVPPTLAQVAFLLVAAFLVVTKSWSPQASLALLPFAVMAVPQWRVLLPWQIAECFLWMMTMLWFLQRDITAVNAQRQQRGQTLKLVSGVDYPYLGLMILLRVVAIGVIGYFVVRQMRPARNDEQHSPVVASTADQDTTVTSRDEVGSSVDPAVTMPDRAPE
ncbi:MAG: hypothetical protein ABI137_07880 [Antricoccus sp.]